MFYKKYWKFLLFIKCTWSGRTTWGRTPVWSWLGVLISIFCFFDKFESRSRFLLQVATFKKFDPVRIFEVDLLLSHHSGIYHRMHAHCQVVGQVKPEVVSWSWTLIQVWVSINGLEKVIAGIFYPLVSFLVDIFSPHKPLSCSNHVIILKYFWNFTHYSRDLWNLCLADQVHFIKRRNFQYFL